MGSASGSVASMPSSSETGSSFPSDPSRTRRPPSEHIPIRRSADTMASPARPDGSPVRSYRTRFPLTEDPISEDGLWVNGKTDGIDWADVVTEHGVAHGGKVKVGARERRAEQGNLEGGEAAAP